MESIAGEQVTTHYSPTTRPLAMNLGFPRGASPSGTVTMKNQGGSMVTHRRIFQPQGRQGQLSNESGTVQMVSYLLE
jgi:hypothetical protein